MQFEEGSLNQYLVFGVGFVLMLVGQIYFMPIGLDKADLDKSDSETVDEASEQDSH